MSAKLSAAAGLLLALALIPLAAGLAPLVRIAPLPPYAIDATPPVTNWLLTTDTAAGNGIPSTRRLAWQKIGAKLWTFLTEFDHDFVSGGKTVPPSLGTRVFGRAGGVTCGRFARQFIRLNFHDAGTFDIGRTGWTTTPRFGANGSLRREMNQCTTPPGVAARGPRDPCWNNVERRFDLVTGAYLNEDVFAAAEAKWGYSTIDWNWDQVNPRPESTGFGMAMALFYQIKFEARNERLTSERITVSIADIIQYAGMMALARCGGPHVEFQPGRPDANAADAAARLPAPTEPLSHSISYFWANGLTNFDMVALLSAHTTACFSIACLDSTPSLFDAAWANEVNSFTSGDDPRICAFPRVDVANPVPPPPVPLCFLPSDVEMNARNNTRPYLRALGNFTTITEAANNVDALPRCDYQPGIPNTFGNCNAVNSGTQVGVPAFKPFALVSTAGGSVNMCNRPGAVGCGPGSTGPMADVFATSLFKLSKLFVRNGVFQGAAYAQPQPCQEGLIKIGVIVPPQPAGAPPVPTTPVPRCNCCPNPQPQDWSFLGAAADPVGVGRKLLKHVGPGESVPSPSSRAAGLVQAPASAPAITNTNAQAWAAWVAATGGW